MSTWESVLELDTNRNRKSGNAEDLAAAIRNAADLRIYTEFLHNEHIDVKSDSDERIREVAEFGITYLLEDSWSAGIMNLRQPIELPVGFGPRPSMSFFLYNQNGQQAIARPHLDGGRTEAPLAASTGDTPEMPKYHTQSIWDAQTNAPCNNFNYDFDVYRFNVCDSWRQVLSHDENGAVQSSSVAELVAAFSQGCEVKVGVRDLCRDLPREEEDLGHEVFVQAGSCYYYTEKELFIAGTHPLVRAAPTVPMLYQSRAWDFGWLMVRTDGHIVYRRCDPFTLEFEDIKGHYAIRWFVR